MHVGQSIRYYIVFKGHVICVRNGRPFIAIVHEIKAQDILSVIYCPFDIQGAESDNKDQIDGLEGRVE